MAATPDVAMILALLGTRLRSVGMMLSAQWSNLLPSNVDRYLERREARGERAVTWGGFESVCRSMGS